jgi:cell division septation protein DedD
MAGDQPATGEVEATSSPQWVVEVASFSDPEDAQNLLTKLEGEGLPAYLAEVTVRGREWHRVTVGSYYKESQAREMMDKIGSRFGIKDSWLRPIREKDSRM